MKLFISWAKDSSKEIALALHQWIPAVTLHNVKTWCSADPACLPQGSGFPESILAASKDTDACLVILTRENLSAWWVNFEAGLFFGQQKKVYAILCGDLTHSVLGAQGHPLSVNGVNYTSIDKDSLSSFLTSLKSNDPDWLKNDFKTTVDSRFESLKSKYDAIFNENYQKISALLSKTTETGM